VSRYAFPALLLLWGLLFLFSLGGLDYPVGDGDEAIHAVILQEMIASGRFLRTTWQGAPHLFYPLLPYWLGSIFAQLIPNEAGLRMSSALASFATLVVVYRGSVALWGSRAGAAMATILLAGAPVFHTYTRSFMTDAPFVLAVAIATVGAARAQREPAQLRVALVGLGAAVACKSLAAAIPGVALLPWLWGPMRRAGVRSVAASLGLAAAFALPFYVISFAQYGDQFWREHFLYNVVGRSRGGLAIQYGLQGGVEAYLLWLPRVEGPAVVAWLAAGSLGAVGIGSLARQRTLLLLGLTATTIFVLWSLLSTRLLHYVLPAYPAAALAMAGIYELVAARWPLVARPLARPLAPALGVLVLLTSVQYSGGSGWLLQGRRGRDLGLLAARVGRGDEPVYALEWYGPSLAYYAERRAVLLTHNRKHFEALKIPYVMAARAAYLVPPAPVPVGTSILVTAPMQDLMQAPWLRVEEVLGASPPCVLARATVITPGATR
jgi:4-amino-4-deoxy-L-arabinose transferase-like glycosyltransferase